jgi:hypothetical protein
MNGKRYDKIAARMFKPEFCLFSFTAPSLLAIEHHRRKVQRKWHLEQALE